MAVMTILIYSLKYWRKSMVKKSFEKMLNKNQDNKIDVNLQSENDRLREKIKELENKKDNSEAVKVDVSSIVLVNNIRLIDFELDDIEGLAKDIKVLGQLQPVLLSKDNRLLAGYRRYNAIKFLGIKEIYAMKLEKTYDEIGDNLLLQIQYSENENRRNLDNFQLSKVFNDLKTHGKNQKEISEIFNKPKGSVSAIVSLKKIIPELVRLLKEFQVYAWSKQKFSAENQVKDAQDESFYQANRGIIGYQSLYLIAKHSNIEDQKKAFLKGFRNRLSEEELNSEFFKGTYENMLNSPDNKFTDLMKTIKDLSGMISEVKNNIPAEKFKKAEKYLSELQDIFVENSEKIK